MQPGRIQRVSRDTHRAISSAQVVTTLASVVKELIDNSIDAGASAIDVIFVDSGLTQVSVTDNGSGIPVDDEATLSTLVVDRATSKSAAYIDTIFAAAAASSSQSTPEAGCEEKTLGFRGEALHSIATLATLSITTKTATMPQPLTLEYRLGGTAVAAKRAAVGFPHATGTRMAVTDLFQKIPVRRKELESKIKAQFASAVNLIKQIAIAHSEVRFHVSCGVSVSPGQPAKAPAVAFATRGSGDFAASIADVYGGKFASQLMKFSCRADGFVIDSLISKIGDGRATGDMQFFSLDGRPVDLPKLASAINECFVATHPSATIRVPVVFMALRTDTAAADASAARGALYDPNVAPDKRSAIFDDEGALINSIRRDLLAHLNGALATTAVGGVEGMVQRSSSAQLGSLMSDAQRQISASAVPPARSMPVATTVATTSTPPAESVETVTRNGAAPDGVNQVSAPVSQRSKAAAERRQSMRDLVPDLARNTDSDSDSFEDSDFLVSSSSSSSDDVTPQRSAPTSPVRLITLDNGTSPPRFVHEYLKSTPLQVGAGGTPLGSGSNLSLNVTQPPPSADDATAAVRRLAMTDDNPPPTSSTAAAPVLIVDQAPAQRTAVPTVEVIMPVDERSFRMNPAIAAAQLPPGLSGGGQRPLPAPRRAQTGKKTANTAWSGLGSSSAEQELQRNFTRQDFERMSVAGQFNDGFIIATLDDHVFVLDQHASDEKHTFETLRASYVPKAQRLLAPIRVVADEPEVEAAYRYQDALAAHGFRLSADETKVPDALYVSAIPLLEYDTVKADDILELTSQLVRYGRIDIPMRSVWHSTATKACRTSIMIGKALDLATMRRVVSNMATMDHPWNCPHGRPTMRFVTDLSKKVPDALDPRCSQTAPDLTPLLKRHRAEQSRAHTVVSDGSDIEE